MAEGSISTSDLQSYVFDSFGEETKSDDELRSYDDAGELSYETDRDSGVCLIDIWVPVMMKLSLCIWRKSCLLCHQCNIVQLMLLANYHTFGKYVTSLFIICILVFKS